MTALVSFDRVFEVLDLPPMITDKPDARPVPPGPARIEFDHVDFRYPDRRGGVAGLARIGGRPRSPPCPARSSSTSPSPPSRASWWPWSARRGRARPPSANSCPASTTSPSGAIRINGLDVRDATFASLTATIGVVTQDAHLFHETIRAEPALRQARRHRGRAGCGPGRRPDRHHGRLPARRHRHRGRRPRLPAVRWREAASGHRPHPAQGARGGRAGRGHRPPRLGVRGGRAEGAGHRPRWAAPRWSSPTGCRPSGRRT